MGFALPWMPARAPYMPVATVGLLSTLEQAGCPARAQWKSEDGRWRLSIETDTALDVAAATIAESPWPDLDLVPWQGKPKQALKPTIAQAPDQQRELRRLIDKAPPLERSLLGAICTDGALDDSGAPGRSRLLRGVKADLSSVADCPRISPELIAEEIDSGLHFRKGHSGRALGLAPEVQTFGATTGPDASSVGAHSTLLYLLLWRGLLAITPFAVARGNRRVVGSHMTTAPDVISWPVWTIPVDRRGLLSVLAHPEVHSEEPQLAQLAGRGIAAIYRARAVPLNTMVAVYRWGELIAEGSGGDA